MTSTAARLTQAEREIFARIDAILNTCVQCGLCLPGCPTYRETYREQSSPRGRLHLMRAVAEGRLDVLDPVFTDQMAECLGCRACEPACPSGVAYGAALETARTAVEQARAARGRRSWRERILRRLVFDWLLRDLARVRALGTVAWLAQRGGLQALARRGGLVRALRLERLEAQLPPLSRPFFAPRGQVYPARGERRGRAGLLAGCVMHTAFAPVMRATVRVLTRNGWEVVVPAGQGCCAALHLHAGEPGGARALARRLIAAFDAAGTDVVVTNSAGCGAAMKEYGHLLRDDPAWADRAAAFSARVRDVTELLAQQPLRGHLAPLHRTVVYQDPCHLLHAQRIAAAPRALLRAVPGLRLVEADEAGLCCGSAGSYSLLRPEMSERLLRRKLDHLLAAGAEEIATANPGCTLQLRSGLRRRGLRVPVRHVVELLDEAYR
jgi:glycolate oxidase iron-sulfur subunit